MIAALFAGAVGVATETAANIAPIVTVVSGITNLITDISKSIGNESDEIVPFHVAHDIENLQDSVAILGEGLNMSERVEGKTIEEISQMTKREAGIFHRQLASVFGLNVLNLHRAMTKNNGKLTYLNGDTKSKVAVEEMIVMIAKQNGRLDHYEKLSEGTTEGISLSVADHALRGETSAKVSNGRAVLKAFFKKLQLVPDSSQFQTSKVQGVARSVRAIPLGEGFNSTKVTGEDYEYLQQMGLSDELQQIITAENVKMPGLANHPSGGQVDGNKIIDLGDSVFNEEYSTAVETAQTLYTQLLTGQGVKGILGGMKRETNQINDWRSDRWPSLNEWVTSSTARDNRIGKDCLVFKDLKNGEGTVITQQTYELPTYMIVPSPLNEGRFGAGKRTTTLTGILDAYSSWLGIKQGGGNASLGSTDILVGNYLPPKKDQLKNCSFTIFALKFDKDSTEVSNSHAAGYPLNFEIVSQFNGKFKYIEDSLNWSPIVESDGVASTIKRSLSEQMEFRHEAEFSLSGSCEQGESIAFLVVFDPRDRVYDAHANVAFQGSYAGTPPHTWLRLKEHYGSRYGHPVDIAGQASDARLVLVQHGWSESHGFNGKLNCFLTYVRAPNAVEPVYLNIEQEDGTIEPIAMEKPITDPAFQGKVSLDGVAADTDSLEGPANLPGSSLIASDYLKELNVEDREWKIFASEINKGKGWNLPGSSLEFAIDIKAYCPEQLSIEEICAHLELIADLGVWRS